jgi:hypothetical protein
LQERVFSYAAADGAKFKQVWFLMVLESLANVVVGFLGMQATGPTKGLPLGMFAASGVTQVSAKAFTNLALRYGVRLEQQPFVSSPLQLSRATSSLAAALTHCEARGTSIRVKFFKFETAPPTPLLLSAFRQLSGGDAGQVGENGAGNGGVDFAGRRVVQLAGVRASPHDHLRHLPRVHEKRFELVVTEV